jgi:hypothetical protein
MTIGVMEEAEEEVDGRICEVYLVVHIVLQSYLLVLMT